MKDWQVKQLSKILDLWLEFKVKDLAGIAVGVSQDDQMILNKSYGYANLENKEKLTPQHIFRIASHSKTFTATAIMQLTEQGKFSLDDPLAKHISWLKDHRDKRFREITIKQVLSHQAGIIRDGEEHNFWQLHYDFPHELKQEILASDLILAPGKNFKYSNYGFSLLGLVVQAASGQPYNEYVKENIVKRLALKNTGPEYTPEIKDKLVTGYTRDEEPGKRLPIIKSVDTHSMSSATGFYSTPADICRFMTALMPGNQTLLKDSSKEEMQKKWAKIGGLSYREEYGLGVVIEYEDKRRLVGHSGGFPGQVSQTFFDPETKIVVTVMINANSTPPTAVNHAIWALINMLLKEKAEAKGNENLIGIFYNLWGISAVAPLGKHLIEFWPSGWQPFSSVDILKPAGKNSFKVTKTNGYGYEGEEVKFELGPDGKVASVKFAGGIRLPQAAYFEKMAGLKTYGQR